MTRQETIIADFALKIHVFQIRILFFRPKLKYFSPDDILVNTVSLDYSV